MRELTNENGFFCSDISRQSKESIFGTGGIEDVWILLEYPKPWGRNAIAESDLPEEVKIHLKSFSTESKKVSSLFIKQDRKTKKTLDLFIVYIDELSPKIYKSSLQDYNDLLAINRENLFSAQLPLKSSLVKHPLFLVCTNGKRDKCCTKYGFPIYKHMSALAKENVWQSSHVGGDRFASNIVCFPHGIFYGHVLQDDATAIIDSYGNDKLNLKNYRGRCCYSRHGQIAEYFVRKNSDITNLNHLILREIEQIRENAWKSVFYSEFEQKLFKLIFSSSVSTSSNYLTCRATAQKTVNEYHLESFTVEKL